MVYALRSRNVVTPEGVRDAVVVADGERIAAVLAPDAPQPDVPVEDVGDLALLPGLVDAHTHINEPGRTEWEGFWTGTQAAAAGGFTTIVDMPLNCLPETTNVAALQQKRAAAREQCFVDYAFWGGAVDGNQAALAPLAQAGVAGFKCFLIYPGCDGFTAIDAANLELALPHIARTGLPLLVHAELAAPIDAAFAQLERGGADWRRYATHLASRPDEAELQAIDLLLTLCRRYRFRLHIVHLSTAQALPLLAAAKREGLPVTVETCPHYLHCAAEEIPDGATLFKCAPPIRSATNREALWEGLLQGTIDLIATDHSPCPPHMKRLDATDPGMEAGRFDEAWGGIASLSTALPVVWTECRRRSIGLHQLSLWMSTQPAQLAGFQSLAGAIAPGKLASFVLFDPEAQRTLTADHLFQRHALSPYLGETLHGVVRGTWVRGRRVFDGSTFDPQPTGRELQPSAPAALWDWNALPLEAAAAGILPCNGSTAWAGAMAQSRPFWSSAALFAQADAVWQSLPAAHWMEAFNSHPRIGERHAQNATTESLRWSAGEQSAAAGDGASTTTALAEANHLYEQRFGRTFLVCATGKSAEQILAILRERLPNSPEAELREAAEQQRRITQLRLRKWLGLPAAGCDAV